jgi:hypothetical protein
VIPQTYLSHLSKELDKGGGSKSHPYKSSVSSENGTSEVGGGGSARSTSSSQSNHTGRGQKSSEKNKGPGGSNSNNHKSAPSSRERQSIALSRSNSSNTPAPSSSQPPNPTPTEKEVVVGLQNLAELYLSHNRIISLKGFESYGTVRALLPPPLSPSPLLSLPLLSPSPSPRLYLPSSLSISRCLLL